MGAVSIPMPVPAGAARSAAARYPARMDRTRLTGALLMAACALQALLFLAGAMKRSYAALALPVGVLVGVGSVLGFWVGWTLLSMEDDLSGLEYEAEPLTPE